MKRVVNLVNNSWRFCIVVANKVRQSFQLHNNRLPRRYAPRNDDGAASNRLPRRYAPRNDDGMVSNGLPRRYAPRNDLGRSMIEMLGVLAIIGVLSVGGIAGYSKAMEKFKVNKAVFEYSYLIQGLLEYRENLQKSVKGEVFLTDLLISLNLFPNTWKKTSDIYILDNYGNYIKPWYRSKSNRPDSSPEQFGIFVNISFGKLVENENGKHISADFNEKLCVEILEKIVFPLHNTLKGVLFAGNGNKVWNGYYLGDDFCRPNTTCIRDMTMQKLKSSCSACDKTQLCAVTIIL